MTFSSTTNQNQPTPKFPMDQVKKYLAVAAKNGFWIGSAVIFLGSLLVWFLSTSSLKAELEARISAINGDVNKVSQTRIEVPTAPNPISHAEMERLIQLRTDEVVDAWDRMYRRQRSILTWPRKELKEDFVAEFEHKIPIEDYVVFPTAEEDEVDPSIRVRYRDYIERILPGLAEIAKAKWTASFDNTGMEKFSELVEGGGFGQRPVIMPGMEEVPLVQWSSGSQSAVLTDLFPWRGKRPSTLEVYYSQENIWIYKQMLQIVADVNGDAELPFQAKIREIKELAIGKSVDFSAGEIAKPGETFGGFGADDDGYGDDGDYDDGGDGGDYDDGFGSYGESADPGDNRYVNTRLEPITGAQLRTALQSRTPEDANIAVAKRVPVMMSFIMDQRAVPDLVAACGSADLMVEVRQVRILPDMSTGYGGGTSMFGGGGGGDDGDGGDDEGGGGGMGFMPMNVKTEPVKEFPFDMKVEVYGLIYIYNPPQAEKLGVDQVDQNTVIDGKRVMDNEAVEGALPAPDAAEPDNGQTPPAGAPPVPVPPTALRTP